MQKPIMAVTGDETGKDFRERDLNSVNLFLKFRKIIYEPLNIS